MTRLEKLAELSKEVKAIRNHSVIVKGIEELNAIKVQGKEMSALYNAVSEEYKDKATARVIAKGQALKDVVTLASEKDKVS